MSLRTIHSGGCLVRRVAALVALLVAAAAPTASAAIIYDGIPSPDPAASPSLGYQATSTAEFGDYIAFGGGPRQLSTVRVGLVSWAEEGAPYTDSSLTTTTNGWLQDLTFNIYAVDHSGATPAVGSLLATLTDTFEIQWAPNSTTHPFVPVTFDFSSQNILLPDEVIYGLAFNTQTYGDSPTGVTGPYNSLNFAVGGNGGTHIPPTVGTDVDPDAVFWNTSHAAFYADGGTAGVGTFRQDTNWTPYAPMVEFAATPEPTSLLVFAGLGLCGAASHWRKKKRNA